MKTSEIKSATLALVILLAGAQSAWANLPPYFVSQAPMDATVEVEYTYNVVYMDDDEHIAAVEFDNNYRTMR